MEHHETEIEKNLFEAALMTDPGENDRGEEAAVLWDKDWLGESKLVLDKGKTKTLEGDDPNLAYYEVPLVLKVQLHPALNLEWAIFRVDLSYGLSYNAKLYSVFPEEVNGDKPLKLDAKLGLGMKLEVAKSVVAEVKPELAVSQTIYYPKVEGIAGEKDATWNFFPQAGGSRSVNNILRLVASVPQGELLKGAFTFKAKIRRANLLTSWLPVIGSGRAIIDKYTLSE